MLDLQNLLRSNQSSWNSFSLSLDSPGLQPAIWSSQIFDSRSNSPSSGPRKNKSRLRGSGSLGRMSVWNNMSGFMNDKLCRWRRSKSCVAFWTTHFFHLVSPGFTCHRWLFLGRTALRSCSHKKVVETFSTGFKMLLTDELLRSMHVRGGLLAPHDSIWIWFRGQRFDAKTIIDATIFLTYISMCDFQKYICIHLSLLLSLLITCYFCDDH